MIPSFSIRNKEKNIIVITGLTMETDEYLPEDAWVNSYYNFKYSDCITINIIQRITTQEDSVYTTIFNRHDILLDESIVELPQDGLYGITHIILPTVDWLKTTIQDDPTFIEEYSGVYVTDGIKIYKYLDGQYLEISPDDILNIPTDKTTISKASNYTFSIWKLQECYILLCNTIFSSGMLKCSKYIDSNLTMKRDIAWMTINVIKYYLSFGQLYEAQRVLEEINYCQGLCGNLPNTYKNSFDCGCS